MTDSGEYAGRSNVTAQDFLLCDHNVGGLDVEVISALGCLVWKPTRQSWACLEGVSILLAMPGSEPNVPIALHGGRQLKLVITELDCSSQILCSVAQRHQNAQWRQGRGVASVEQRSLALASD